MAYNIDAIERELRDALERWGSRAVVDRIGDRIDVFEPGILDHEYNDLTVTGDGFFAIHWSLPRGIALQSIIEDHRVQTVTA